MGRYRSRSRSLSYSPRRRSRTPPRGRKRYEDDYYPSHRDRRSPAPSGLLIRNLPLDARGHGARDDDYSLGRSRTIPSSRSPRDDENRSRKRSLSPRENGHSPHDERNYSPHQSGSPRGGSRSPSGPRSRSYSPR
ncbi:serine/arginine-rich SC35-like splicing factor SCL28 isoform X2 [Tripterygium wilfordii]|uniref:Serine/arginine-rich SC35-like splicing factor SCL28 isoform X2 n=1 Tax=Tripterygium wilfordii TaxID=458696 RepID=A0A7J7CS67_TRIWF|nr:serine/arginine-rich SC35-like splicing factor SCL28 isoform X2 [Tripterygium wilfordii]